MAAFKGLVRRALHPLYRRLETEVHPLRYLFLEITQKCNLDCLHCGSDCGRDSRLPELTADQWIAVLDYIPEHFDKDKVLPVITGGEPLCRPDLDEILAAMKRNGLRFGLVTNGYALTGKRIGGLVDAGMVSATVSLDGLAESHDWLRGRSGSFERAAESIRCLQSSGIPMFDVVTCANPRNLSEMDELRELLRELGVGQWRIFLIFPKGRARGNAELLLGEDGTRDLVRWIARARREAGPDDIAISWSCEGYFPADIGRAIRDEPYFCRAGISIGSVLCDGSISACPNLSRELVQGNVLEDDLHKVWVGKFEAFRHREWMRTGDCEGCGEWKRCLGNSLHLWDDESRRTARCFYSVCSGIEL